MVPVSSGNSCRGFSLIDLVVALALLAIVMSMMSTAFTQFRRATVAIGGRSDRTAFIHYLQVFLEDPQQCAMNFSKISTVIDSNTLITEIDYYNPSTGAITGTPLAKIGVANKFDFVPSKFLTSVLASAGTNQVLADLAVFSADSNIAAHIPMAVTLTGGILSDCTTGPMTTLNFKQIGCTTSSNGIQFFDPTQQACVSRLPTTLVSGTPYFVACPNGFNVYSNQCQAQPPPGFVDPDIGSTRTYANGQTLTVPPSPSLCTTDASGVSCSCAYDSSVNTAGFVAQAQCVDPRLLQ
ncbi:MAG: hypothetical protein C5B49_08475 [Bdellovibrio sp.]|nr:MAG: hypothetical protein C5B49_08475 [Bdellovibrio sp.]